jgi:hypothetical protein
MIYGIPIGYLLLCFIIAYLGRNRSMTFWGYFFASVVLTPLVGALLVVVSRKREDKK